MGSDLSHPAVPVCLCWRIDLGLCGRTGHSAVLVLRGCVFVRVVFLPECSGAEFHVMAKTLGGSRGREPYLDRSCERACDCALQFPHVCGTRSAGDTNQSCAVRKRGFSVSACGGNVLHFVVERSRTRSRKAGDRSSGSGPRLGTEGAEDASQSAFHL